MILQKHRQYAMAVNEKLNLKLLLLIETQLRLMIRRLFGFANFVKTRILNRKIHARSATEDNT